MRISPAGIDLIKRFEGLELEAYRDIAGVWTIGYGHTAGLAFVMALIESGGAPGALLLDFPFIVVDGKLKITKETAEALLFREIERRQSHLNGWAIMREVVLNQNQFDALVSFIYNVGFDAFRVSTAAKRLEKGDITGAADALTWWNKATVGGKLRAVDGLTRRRNAEKNLFLTPPNWSPPPRALAVTTYSPLDPVDHRESNACAAKECRPLAAWLPSLGRLA